MRATPQVTRTLLVALCIFAALGSVSLLTGQAFFGHAPRASQPQPSQQLAMRKGASPAPARFGPRLRVERGSLPNYEWKATASAGTMSFFAPVVTAVKSVTLGTDVNGNTFVNPGDTLMYSVVVSNGAAPGAGNDALNVVFTDQLNANLTQMGAATASPIGTNDSYTCLGNVGITVPDGASDLLANDVSPDGTAISVTAVNTAGTQGTVMFNANGSFSFMPTAGFEGTTTFAYTVSSTNGKTDSGTVTITVNEVIWFVDNNSANGDGRLGTPFSSIANFNSGAADEAGDIIFVYRQSASDYTGSALTLLADQKLIGQGSTASLATSFTPNLTVPPFSNPLPATGGTRPTLTNTNTNITLSTGNTIRGLNIQNTTAGSALLGTSFNNLTISETTVSSANATAAVNLDQSSGTASINATFISVAANTCTNGIVLADTTGSFTIIGGNDTSVGGDSSGGTIQNTTSHAISLTNTSNPSFTNLNIQNIGRSGIDGQQVTNFTFKNGTINNVGTAAAGQYEESNIAFNDGGVFTNSSVSGTVTITQNILNNARRHGIQIENGTGTISNLTISNNTLTSSTNAAVSLGTAILALIQGSAATTAHLTTGTINGNTITNFPSNEGIAILGGSGNGGNVSPSTFGANGTPINITNNMIAGQSGAGARLGSNGIRVSFNGQVGVCNFNISINNISFIDGQGISVFMGGTVTGTTTVNGNTINANQTDLAGTNGMALQLDDGPAAAMSVTPNYNFVVTGNNVSNYEGSGIRVITRMNLGQLDATIQNNTVTAPTMSNRNGIRVDAGLSAPSDTTLCLLMTGNTSAGSGVNQGIGIRKQGTVAATHDFGIVGLSPSPTTGANAAAKIVADNPAGGGVDVLSGDNFTGCGVTALYRPEQPTQRNQLAQVSAAPTFFARLQHLVRPVYSAFASSLSYANLNRAFDKATEAIAPTATAAELVVPPSGGSDLATNSMSPKGGTTNKPARTMLVNSRGEYRIVPTAALPKLMAGELITINGTGSGFTLPAGESTTIMFNAQISSSYTLPSISNQASVSGSGFGPILSNNLATNVIQPPALTKSFSPANIATNGTSTLQFALINTNNSQTLTQMTFTDVLPVGLNVTDGTQSACGGTVTRTAATRTIALTGGSLAVGPPCVFNVTVTAGATEGTLTNTTGAPDSLESDPGTAATANINVINPPTFTKAFGAPFVALNGTTSLTFTITNNSAISGLNGIGFTDTLPGGLTVAATPNITGTCGGGTISAVGNGGTISLSGATFGTGGSCTFSVDVTGTSTGAKPNSATLATTELGATSATTGTVTLNVFAPPTLSKFFVNPNQLNSNNTSLNGTARLAIAITNPPGNPGNLTGLAITDTFPAGIEVDNPVTSSNNCGGTFAPNPGDTSISLSGGGALTPGNQCTIFVIVKATMVGAIVNTTGNVSSTEGGMGLTASGTLNVFAPPTITKAFSPNNVSVNGISTLTLTITNPAANPEGVLGVAVSDSFPAGLEVDATPMAMNTCGGTFNPVGGATSISLTGGTIGSAGGSCAVSVKVKATTGGAKVNTTGAVSSTQGGAGLTATDTLSVGQPPTVTKSFAPTQISVGGTSTLTISFTNPNAFSLSNLAISDTFPADLEVDATPMETNTCGGTFAPTGGATSISLSGGSLAASPGSCAISVKVKATSSGVKTNTTGNVSTTETGAGSTGTANLTVVGPPDFSKTFTGTFYINGAPIGATETGNTATISLTTAHGFSAGQSVTIAGVGVAGYNGTFTIASVPNSFTFTYTNPSAGLASSGGGTATSVSTLASVPFGAPSTLNFTITNNNTTAALTGIGFTDVLPTGLSVVDATTPNVCGAGSSLTVTAATRTIQLTGGNLAAGSPSPTSCSIPVTVTGNTVGAQVNTTQAITATESGAGGTATATLTVIKANTALSNLTDSPDPTVVGEPYTVGFTLNAVAPGTGTPGGTVMVSDNAGGTCTATLPVTSCSLTSLSVGAKTLSFSYGGDANFNASTNTAGHQVNAASTTTTITNAAALGTATVVGQSYAVTWDVAVNLPGTLGAALTGNVTVDAGGGNTCTAAVSAGTCNIISTTAGLKSITATYAGDTNYIGSTSSPATPHTVNKADTTTTITNAASLGSTPTVVGESYAVNWSVAVNLPGALGAALTGNVTVDAGGGNTCTAAVSAGTCNIISTTAGLKSITATYAGDGNYQGSTSASAAHTVNKPGTTTTINSDLPAPSVTGQAYTVSVSVGVVPPGMGTPTGTVNVNDGTGGSCVVTLSGGMGSCSLTSTTAGTKTLTASYLGDTNFEVSSGTKMHQVDKANTTAVINSDAPDASVVGQPVTVAYTVTANLPGGGIPTGNVLVTDGVNSCTGTLNASGQGSCTVALFTPGVRTLTATYQSDANYNASPASAGAGHQVNPANTTTAVTSSPNPSVFGQPVTFTATVTASAPGAGTPTGTVTFTIDGNPQVPVTLNGSGQASLTVSSLTVAGSPHAVSAAYNGSASYNTSTGTLTGGQVVNKANTATTITSDNPDSSAVGQNVTVNFTVTPVAPGAGPRTGTVTITVSGGSETCTGTLDGSGTGSCTLALTVPGDRTLTATYNGDANFNGSSDTEAHTVVAPPVIAKSFNPMAVPLNGVSTLTLAITNPAVNTVALTGVSVTDNFLPGAPGIVVHTTPAATNSCATGTFAPVAGANSISLSGATIPVGTTCNFTVQVRGTISGPQVNTTGNVSSTNGGTGNTATATLQVNVPPVITPINLARAAGTTTANLQIATATDVEDPEDQLVVQISTDGLNFFNSVTTGNVTIALVDQVPGGSVNPTAAGAVLATITTPCNATVGPLNLFLRATDTGGQLDTKPWTLTITPNTPPVLSYGTQTITAGTTPMFNPATGPSDNGTLNPLVLQPISPATGLMLSLNPATGQLAVTSATLIGNYTVTVTATDQCGAVTNASFTVNVICPTITLAPASLPGGTVNTAYSQTVSAAPSGTTYSYAVTSGALPNGLTLNAATGALTGTPTLSGTFNFRVTASGWGGCTGFRDYVIIVVCPTITLTPASLPGGTVGTAYNQTVSAAPAGTYNYAVSSGALPTGLSLNAATGAITGTPTASGVFGFTLTASSGGCSGSQAYSVTIVCPAITLAPATLPGAQAGVAYDQTVTANPAGAYTFSLVAGNLPPGLNLNAATGQLSGLATATGNYNFTLKAQAASGCSGTQAYTLTVTCPVISVNPASGALSGGTVGTAYNQSFSATPAGNYSFTKTSGTLPPGLSLNSASGLLSGTPTTQGTYSFTVTATGFGTCTGSRAYTLTIAASCATITLPALPATGTVGVNYSGNLAATTPSASYTFTVDSGALPPGLTINNLFGQLSGKPTVAGVYNFTLKATRSNGCSGTRAYTITVGGGSFARLRNDFDGDGKSDLILRQTGTGNWLLTLSGSGATETVSFGAATDLPVFGDYDGDGKTDLAVYQSGAATWLLRLSSTGATVEQRVAGLPADAQVTPLNADFDGDGRTDLALWESATASWFVQRSTDGKQLSFQFGTAGDVAVPADYDGDGRADLAVFERASARWRIQQSGDNSAVEHQFGTPKDAPLASDFDGDGRADLAVWRAAEGALYVQASRTAPALRLVVGVASAADWLLLGDYDGDGKTEPAVWRAIEARWYLRFSSNAALFIQVPGQLGLVPVTNGQ